MYTMEKCNKDLQGVSKQITCIHVPIAYIFGNPGSGGSKGGGVRGVRTPPPLRFPGRSSCTWKNSLYLLKNSVKICMIRSIS